jgi:CBS domain-containing protein
MTNRLADILDEKGRVVHRIEASASAHDAVERMVAANVGSLLVTEENEIVGIFTERDYLRRVALLERSDRETQVRAVMSTPVIVATPETAVEECMALMTDRRIRHVPVVAEAEVVGLISIGDLVEFTSRRQAFEIQYLTDYITAR